MPKGSYVPTYVRAPDPPVEPVARPALTSTVEQVAPLLPVVPAPAWKRHWPLAAAFSLGAAVMSGAFALRNESPVAAGRAESAGQWTADLESIWRPFLDPRTPVLVSYQTRLFLSVGPVVVRDTEVDSFASVESSDLASHCSSRTSTAVAWIRTTTWF